MLYFPSSLSIIKSYLNLVPDRYIRKQTLANCERYITEELNELESKILGAETKVVDLEYKLFIESYYGITLLNEYDLILFDAAKVQNIRFFEKYLPLLKEQGILVTDNILFHGCVENRDNLTKNVLNMVKKIDKYNEFLKQLDNYDTYFLPVGDGQAIAVKKGK